jgi:GT2 family glycosyltransferase
MAATSYHLGVPDSMASFRAGFEFRVPSGVPQEYTGTSMKLSVVIPTYNRKEILRRSIGAYLSQSIPPSEILVVDDGSSDGTAEVPSHHPGSGLIKVRYFRQDNRGPGAARNVGIREAAGQLILFTDDDIIPAVNMVAEHLAWHEKHPEPSNAMCGRVTWSPEIKVTPFMKWYGERGLVDYRGLGSGTRLDVHHFWSGHLSFKTNYLRQAGFYDEDFKNYGWEDFELGYRLLKRGLQLFFDPGAIGYHYQSVTFRDACRRARRVNAALQLLEQKEAGKYFIQWKKGRDSELGRRLSMGLAKRMMPVLALVKPLLDSRIPLPWAVYRSFYWYYGSTASRAP